ncbi:hypothetical protein BH23BAC3_BH23BAC3_25580 [soil metagenome]
MKEILATLITFSLLIFTNCGQKKSENETTKQIDSCLSELENVGFRGSVLVDIHGEQIVSNGYGFSDAEKQIKNSPTTIFDIGSSTKQFTASAKGLRLLKTPLGVIHSENHLR